MYLVELRNGDVMEVRADKVKRDGSNYVFTTRFERLEIAAKDILSISGKPLRK